MRRLGLMMGARAEHVLVGAVLGLVVVTGGCSREQAGVSIGEELITVENVVAESRDSAYDTLRDEPQELVAAALGRLVVQAVVTAPAVSDDEAELLKRNESRRVVQQCVAVELKQLLATRSDLDQEARSRFARDPQRYTLPESFRLQMIFIPADEPDGGRLAQELLAGLRQSPDQLARLARQHSRSETAARGGETKPMPGSSVHPDMRSAINEHRHSDDPFLVQLDRGWYILRVLEFWPPPSADFETSMARVRTAVGSELVAELRAEIVAEVGKQHDIRVLSQVLAAPELPPDTVVYTVDGTAVTVRDLLPGVAAVSAVPGPLVRRRLAEYRSWSEPALHLGCQAPKSPPASEEALLAMRLPGELRRFAETEMSEELESFSRLHRQALVREPQYIFDIWIMPFSPGDPYQHFTRLQQLLAAPQPEDEAAVAAAGAILNRGVRAGAGRIDQYEPLLGPILNQVAVGELSRILRSSHNGAFLAVRLVEREPERPLSFDDPSDRKQIVEQLITSSPKRVLDAFADHHLEDTRAVTRLLDASVQALLGDGLERSEDRPAASGGEAG